MMKFVYPAIIEKTKTGYHASFPDLMMCEADGETLGEVLDHAQDMMYSWIDVELQEDEPDLPGVTDEEDMDLKEGQFVRNIMITYRFHSGWDE